MEEIDIDVYRSLHTLKAEPSSGSSFFLDAIVEWRVCDFFFFLASFIPVFAILKSTLEVTGELNLVLRASERV